MGSNKIRHAFNGNLLLNDWFASFVYWRDVHVQTRLYKASSMEPTVTCKMGQTSWLCFILGFYKTIFITSVLKPQGLHEKNNNFRNLI